jgi:hypothetical protein
MSSAMQKAMASAGAGDAEDDVDSAEDEAALDTPNEDEGEEDGEEADGSFVSGPSLAKPKPPARPSAAYGSAPRAAVGVDGISGGDSDLFGL